MSFFSLCFQLFIVPLVVLIPGYASETKHVLFLSLEHILSLPLPPPHGLIFVIKLPGLGSNRWEVEELSVINGPWGFFGFVPLEVQSVCSPTFLQCFAKQVQFVLQLKLMVFIIGVLGFRPIYGCCRKANAEPGTNDGWSFERIKCWHGGGSLSSYLSKCLHTNGSFLFPVVGVGRGSSSLLGFTNLAFNFQRISVLRSWKWYRRLALCLMKLLFSTE